MPLKASRYRVLIEQAAAGINWDPLLLEAQVWIESSDQPDAFRYEPQFYRTYLQGRAAWTEWGPLAACSYGLLQIVYATARDDGYRDRPEALFDPLMNLHVGCAHLDKLRRQIAGVGDQSVLAVDTLAVLASYNGGLRGNTDPPYRNLGYAQKVLERYQLLKERP